MAALRSHPIPCVALVFLVAAATASAKEPAAIPVVKTWGELMDVEPLDVKGQAVRLGIEADTFGTTGGVLLYCLTDGHIPGGVGGSDDALGPVEVRLASHDKMDVMSKALTQLRLADAPGPRLYVKPLTAEREVKLAVSVLIPEDAENEGDEVVLAAREVTVRGEYHGWRRLVTPWREPVKLRQQVAGEDPVYDLEPGDGAWAPHREGWRPFVFERAAGEARVRRGRDEALPTLFPQSPDPGLRLSGDGVVLTLESNEPLFKMVPHTRLLARWWVNGKPAVPPPARRLHAEQQTVPLRQAAKKLQLRLRWDEDLGLQRGDRVRLQLLYSPARSHSVGTRQHLEQLQSAREEGDDFVSKMSNEIEFVVQ